MKKIIFGIIILVFGAIGSLLVWRYYVTSLHHNKRTGTVIILNGPFASGKTSIQNKVQELSDQLYLKMGIESFFNAMLPIDMQELARSQKMVQYTKEGEFIRSLKINQNSDGMPFLFLTVGSAMQRAIKGLHRAIRAYALAGNNVVVDYVLYDQAWLSDLVTVLHDLDVYFVGIKCPLNVLEEREKLLEHQFLGHARSHYATVHDKLVYDLELDTSALTPEQCAQKTLETVTTRMPYAIKLLKNALAEQTGKMSFFDKMISRV